MNVSQSVSKKNIALLLDLLAQAHRIAIVCHARPDGDAVGSMTALAQVLAMRGHDVLCIAPTAVPAPLRWVAGFELVKTFSLDGQYISFSTLTTTLSRGLTLNSSRPYAPATPKG